MPELETLFGSRFSTKPRYQSFKVSAMVKLLIASVGIVSCSVQTFSQIVVICTNRLVDPIRMARPLREAESRR